MHWSCHYIEPFWKVLVFFLITNSTWTSDRVVRQCLNDTARKIVWKHGGLRKSCYQLWRLCICQFQAPTSPPGDPRSFALYCCPRVGIYTWWPSPGAEVLHIHKITFSTVKKYTFTQLVFGSYLHALHRQFRLSILAWLNTKILK